MIYPRTIYKVMKSFFICGILLFLISTPLKAQEFNCNVTINTDQLEGNTFDYLDNFKPVLEDYINEYKWTDYDYEEHERINCQIQIVFNSGSSNFSFAAEAVFQIQRPIYNTTAKTTTVLLNDKTWEFSFPEGRSLIHDELQFDALTGFIDFYVYMMLGYDFDTFSPLGGDPYFSKAQNILNLAQSSQAIGWARANNNRRNRNVLVSEMTTSSYHPLREAYYEYHRQGLDKFIDSPYEARQNVLNAIRKIQENKRRATSNYLFDIFFDAKAREISAIFDEAETDLRLDAYELLRETDQGHLSEYENLQN